RPDAILLIEVPPELDDTVLGSPGRDVDNVDGNGLLEAHVFPLTGLLQRHHVREGPSLVMQQPCRELLDALDADADGGRRPEVAPEDALRRRIVEVDGVAIVEVDLQDPERVVLPRLLSIGQVVYHL